MDRSPRLLDHSVENKRRFAQRAKEVRRFLRQRVGRVVGVESQNTPMRDKEVHVTPELLLVERARSRGRRAANVLQYVVLTAEIVSRAVQVNLLQLGAVVRGI